MSFVNGFSSILKTSLVVLVTVSLVACSTQSPHTVQDRYGHHGVFMMGDSDCTKYRFSDATHIECYNNYDIYTETRQAMTQDEVNAWQRQQDAIAGAVMAVAIIGMVAYAASQGGGGYGGTSTPSLRRDPYEYSHNLQGCCSWHGGVKGCYASTLVCQDNTASPTCSCD